MYTNRATFVDMTTSHTLAAYRRHSKKCEASGRSKTGTCDCTLWVSGRPGANADFIRHSLETSDVATAMRAIDDIARGVYRAGPQKVVTVKEAVGLYFAHLANPDRKLQPQTLTNYMISFKPFMKSLGDRPVGSIDTQDISMYRAGARRQVGDTTWAHDLTRLSSFFVWCAKSSRNWRPAGDNPVEEVPRPPIKSLGTPPLEDEEVNLIIAACDHICEKGMRGQENTQKDYAQRRAKALIYVLLYSGLRVSDVAALERTALNRATGHLTLRTIKSRKQTQVKVQLPPEAVAALVAMPSQSTKYFFWTGESDLTSCISVLYGTVVRLGEISGVPDVHPHRFRDTFAVALLTAGADIRTVQMLLGHTSVRTTEKHYTHFVNAHQALLDAATARLRFGNNPVGPVLVHTRNRRSGNA